MYNGFMNAYYTESILIVGLGNPGKEYENTWHNAGFACLEKVRERLGFDEFKVRAKFNSEMSEGVVNGVKVVLAKPKSFMNLSGGPARAIADFYKIAPSNIWVLYDDIDIPMSSLRIRLEGSAGTHNGMKSMIQHLGSEKFPRFRLGVGEGSVHDLKSDLSDRVLSKIPTTETSVMKKLFYRTAEAIEVALSNGVEAAMTKFNG
jgi:peptidyl-tRNA hydrolase, PTH1 family